jgi:hypothetical protein
MPDQLPDVLQSAGVTPHEVGWLQLHAEPVVRGVDGRAVAELWLQAAFHPTGSGRVELVDAATGTPWSVPLPAVPNGSAVRWRIPFRSRRAPPWSATTWGGSSRRCVRIRASRVGGHHRAGLPEEEASAGLDSGCGWAAWRPWCPRDEDDLRTGRARSQALQAAGVAPAPPEINQQRPGGMKVHRPRVAPQIVACFPPGREQFNRDRDL